MDGLSSPFSAPAPESRQCSSPPRERGLRGCGGSSLKVPDSRRQTPDGKVRRRPGESREIPRESMGPPQWLDPSYTPGGTPR